MNICSTNLTMADMLFKAIAYSYFDKDSGPTVKFIHPAFDDLRDTIRDNLMYLIPKCPKFFQLKTVVVQTQSGCFLIGCSVYLSDHVKYKSQRNEHIFNFSILVASESAVAMYEPIVKKLAITFRDLETESSFLTHEESLAKVPDILRQIYESLCAGDKCDVELLENVICLRKHSVCVEEKLHIRDFDVPVFSHLSDGPLPASWQDCDLATYQLLQLIDGVRNVATIASDASVPLVLVKYYLSNLVRSRLVQMLEPFQYASSYAVQPAVQRLYTDRQLQAACLRAVRSTRTPTLVDVFRLLCAFVPGVTVKDVCNLFSLRALGVDERRLVQFGLVHGLLRKVHITPVEINPSSTARSPFRCDGRSDLDELCNEHRLSIEQLTTRLHTLPGNVCLLYR